LRCGHGSKDDIAQPDEGRNRSPEGTHILEQRAPPGRTDPVRPDLRMQCHGHGHRSGREGHAEPPHPEPGSARLRVPAGPYGPHHMAV